MWGTKSLPENISHPVAGVIAIKVHPRSKRLKLSFKYPAIFSMTVPPGTSERSIQNFILQTESWISKQIVISQSQQQQQQKGFFFQGISYDIVQKTLPGRDIYKFDHDDRIVYLDVLGQSPAQRLAYICRKEFQKVLPTLIKRYSTLMGLFPAKVVLRDTKSRWGSCSSTGHISLSWRLIMAPEKVMDYVIIHEFAHLKHMNHSADFWRLVVQYCPNYLECRRWLKENSRQLHSF